MKRSRGKNEERNGFEEWGGYMDAKKSKLAEQFSVEASKSENQVDELFKGIAIFVNGFTVPSSDELRNLMMKHGGVYHHYQTHKTTHIIATNLPDSKVIQIKGQKIVKPSWIIDSVESKRLLDYRDYLLYNNQTKSQPALKFSSNTLASLDSAKKNIQEGKDSQSPTSENSTKWIAKNASDGRFLSEFYQNSRLHLISTMGAYFKEYINQLRSKESHCFPGLEFLKNMKDVGEGENSKSLYAGTKTDFSNNVVMHIDMDCFFVSVGIRDKPELKGVPVAVTHAKGNKRHHREGIDRKQEMLAYQKKFEEKTKSNNLNSENHWLNSLEETDSMAEIASCSYEARQVGVKNGMFLGQALKFCPNLKTIPYNFEAYKEVSHILYDTVARYTLDIEAMSCDEMFVDCTEILSISSVSPMEFASTLRKEIMEKTGCPCSTGFGSNRLQARLATKKAKPNGQFYIEPDSVEEFMDNVKVTDIPGVGRSTSHKLHAMGISICKELRDILLPKLQSEFGNKLGEKLFKNCRGIDEKQLSFIKLRKSVSAEVNYGIRFENDNERDIFLKQLSEEVSNRLHGVQMKGRCITLKLMIRAKDAPKETAKFLGHGVCDVINKSVTLPGCVSEGDVIFREISVILRKCHVNTKDLRGVGIQISRLEKNVNKTSTNLTRFLTKQNSPEVSSAAVCPPMTGTEKQRNVKEKKLAQANSLAEGRIDSPSVSYLEVDPMFLEALPDELKEEVKQNLKQIAKAEKQSHLDHQLLISSHSKESSNAREIVGENENLAKTPETVEECEGLSYVSPSDMKKMIKEWVNSQETPQYCDVLLLEKYLQQMVISRQIEDLQVLLRTFYREIKKNFKSFWKNAYEVIVQKVQIEMLEVYDAKMMIEEKFD